MKQIKRLLYSIVLTAFALTSFAQTKDCYPNSSVSFDVIERERIPPITSVEAIGTECRVEADKKLAEYRKEDEKDFNLLKNQYFAALSGWEQTDDCSHGGPPPCCTAPAATVPWAVVGVEKAKAALMAKWHTDQSQRQREIEKQIHDCLADLKSAGITKFNDLYTQANDCLKGIQGIKVVADFNKDLIGGYVNQLNDIHAQMQAMAGKTTPNPTAVTHLSTSMQKLQTEICAKLSQLNNPVKHDPALGTAMGVRAEVEKPKVESQAIINSPDKQTQQKAAYQQQANNYLNAANNTTDNDIQKATDLSLAKINSTASGNKAQAAQIQQQQSQQMQQSINTLGNQLIALVNKPQNSDRQLTDAEQKTLIDKQVTEDLKKKGYIFDNNGKATTPSQQAQKDYDAAHLAEYRRNYLVTGKYKESKNIYITVDSLKKWNNTDTRQQTMDFIAGAIWKYTGDSTDNTYCVVTDEISFVDSILQYKSHTIQHFAHEIDKQMIYSFDLNAHPLKFSIWVPFEVDDKRSSWDFVYLNLESSASKSSFIRFYLPLEAIKDHMEYRLIRAFAHLVELSHGKFEVLNK